MKKFIVVLLSILYILSPVDLLPELMGPHGMIDDVVLLAFVVYMLATGRSPLSLFKLFKQPPKQGWSQQEFEGARSEWKTRQAGGAAGDGADERESVSGETDTLKDPYSILEIERNASLDEIKKAYKEKVTLYHPDKVSHLGEEFREIAHRKFVDILWAYNELKRS